MKPRVKVFSVLSVASAMGQHFGVTTPEYIVLRDTALAAVKKYPAAGLDQRFVNDVDRAVSDLLGGELNKAELLSALAAALTDITYYSANARRQILEPVLTAISNCLNYKTDAEAERYGETGYKRYEEWANE